MIDKSRGFTRVRLDIAIVMACVGPSLVACDHSPPPIGGEGRPAISERLVPQSPALSQYKAPSSVATRAQERQQAFSRGTNGFTNPYLTSPQRQVASSGGYTLNFTNAEVSDVARAVLGDILNLNYVIDSTVQGNVTLRTSRPLARAEVLPALEEAFRLSGLALVGGNGGYRIVPLQDAQRGGNARLEMQGHTGPVGYGTDVVPLRYISAADMQRLIAPIAQNEGQIRTDAARNVMLISGTSQERAAIEDSIALFDVDYLAGMSFALMPLKEAAPSAIASELTQIAGTKGGPLDGVVRFLPLDRLRSLLVISSQPKYLDRVRSWVVRLDHADTGDEKRSFVYVVQNGRARDLANVLTQLIGGSAGKGQSAGDAPAQTSGAQSAGPSDGATSFGSANPLLSGLAGRGDGLLQADGPPSGGTSGGPRISADEINNAVLFYGTQKQYAGFEDTLRRLDVPPLQVLLEAVIVEVTLTHELQFGVQYLFQAGHNQILNTAAAATIAPILPGFAYSFVSGQNTNVIIDALSALTTVNVVSAPKILVLNNQVAKLDVGSDVPIITQTAQSTLTTGAPLLNSVEYRETGVILRVTPRVNQSGLVQMDVAQEVSDLSSTTSSTLNSPTFTQRKISSPVAVQDGETIALGGLIKDSRANSLNGIPYLKNIPYVGALFSQRDNTVTRTELLVLITPHVVQSVGQLREVTEELRQRMSGVQQLLK